MRTRLTNVLQVFVLITGIVYMLTGAVFFYSPIGFMEIFFIDVPEDWFRAIQYDTFISPLFFLARAFSAMIFISGIAMILPLYDPLKYRGLIYFTGIAFPLLASSLLLYNGYSYDQLILTIFGGVFLFILLITLLGLIITAKEARAGIE